MFSKEVIKLAKDSNNAIKFLTEKQGKQWKWEPEWLDPLLFTYGKYSEIYWFKCSDLSERFKGWIFVLTKGIEEAALNIPQRDCIPLLHWEKILRLLRDLGYSMFVETQSHNCRATISEDGTEIARKIGEDSQSAVMQATIEAAKKN